MTKNDRLSTPLTTDEQKLVVIGDGKMGKHVEDGHIYTKNALL